jgi:hypothetical protein
VITNSVNPTPLKKVEDKKSVDQSSGKKIQLKKAVNLTSPGVKKEATGPVTLDLQKKEVRMVRTKKMESEMKQYLAKQEAKRKKEEAYKKEQ